jgi:hypothetical protein
MSVQKSQRGGETAFRGLDYQKRFIAYLAMEMLLGNKPIKTITCEEESWSTKNERQEGYECDFLCFTYAVSGMFFQKSHE